MRLKIILDSVGRQAININYNYNLTSLIYNLLRESDESYANFLHDNGYKSDNKRYKMFTFSMLMPERYSVESAELIIEGKVVFYISSPMKEFLLNLISELTARNQIKINKGMFNVVSVEVVKEPEYSNTMKFKCLSPITISTALMREDKRLKKYDLYIEDRRFTENLKSNILSKYKLLYGSYPAEDRFEITFLDVEKYKKGKLINYKDNIRIKGYMAPLEICGSMELIKTAYECGLGDRNSLGMGMIEVDKS